MTGAASDSNIDDSHKQAQRRRLSTPRSWASAVSFLPFAFPETAEI